MATDTAALLARSKRLEIGDLDFESFRSTPLDPATLRCLRYMHDVEGHTACYLRDTLATRTHRDPELTAFLACWAFEEHWHGESIARVLRAHDEVAGPERLAAARLRLPRTDALRPALFATASLVVRHLTAVQMTWGTLNELCTQAGYQRLARRSGHPTLAELLRRIMRQEGRHIDVYATQARARLASSRAAQRITRRALRHLWAPVGTGVMPRGEVRFLVHHLFADDEGMRAAQRIDGHLDRLPGLGGLHLAETAVRRAG